MWNIPRGFDSHRSPHCLLGGSSIGRAVDFGSTGSRFDSEPPRHSGIDQLADRLALTQQVPGSIPGPGAILLCGRRSTGQDTALRTQRREGSNPSARTIFGLSLNWTGHIPPKDAIRVRIPAGRHLRGGDRLVRYSAVYGAYAGSIPVRRAKLFPASSRVERTAVNRLIEVRVLGWEPAHGREMYGAWGAL